MAGVRIEYVYLARDPNSSYRQLSIRGRRIRARTIFGLYASADEPMTIDQIAAAYELPIEAVEEAIAYCRTNPPEILEDFQQEETLAQATGINAPGYRLHGRPHPPADRHKESTGPDGHG